MARSAEVATALVDVCRGRVPHLSDRGAVAEEFVDAVRLHRIAPLAHVLLREDRPDISDRLGTDRDLAMAIHLRSSIVLGELGRAAGDIPWAAFKGPVLSEFFHPVQGLRTYGDIDVLVGPTDLREMSDRLVDIGWIVADPDEHHHNPDTPGEMHWLTPAGLLVDMHWSMINMAQIRRRFNVRTDSLLKRRRRVRLGLATAPVLDPLDAFVHVCMHAGLTGAHRLLWLLDVDQMARQVTDWDAVVQRTVEWQVEAPMAVVVGRATRFLGTPVPSDLVERLGITRSSRRVMDLADRWSPVPSLEKEESIAKAVSRGVRLTGPATLDVLARKAWLGAVARLSGRTAGRRRSGGWTGADAVAQDAYLAAVEAEALPGPPA